MDQVVSAARLALDIGARQHQFAFERNGRVKTGSVANDPTVLQAFLKARLKEAGALQVLVEATGIYFMDVALLATELGAEVMVVNPKAAHNFAKALQQRNKTDVLDALMLLEFLKRMPFVPWQPPRAGLLALRQIGRYLTQLTSDCTVAKNRLHALTSSRICSPVLRRDLRQSIVGLERRIERIRAEALRLIRADPELKAAYEALLSVIGFGETSAVAVLAELAVLPPEMSSRACVCLAGLDVRVHQSGTSVSSAPRLSKHGNKYLRRALFMPALSAGQHDPGARAFRQTLLDRGKHKMQANAALMRKLLTVAWALVRNPAPYDSQRLYLNLQKA